MLVQTNTDREAVYSQTGYTPHPREFDDPRENVRHFHGFTYDQLMINAWLATVGFVDFNKILKENGGLGQHVSSKSTYRASGEVQVLPDIGSC